MTTQQEMNFERAKLPPSPWGAQVEKALRNITPAQWASAIAAREHELLDNAPPIPVVFPVHG